MDVAADVGERVADITPVSVTPHPLIEVAGQLFSRHSLHRLELRLHFGPVRLDGLSVGASHRVNKVLAVVDGGVLVAGVGVQLPVGSPLVAVDRRSG